MRVATKGKHVALICLINSKDKLPQFLCITTLKEISRNMVREYLEIFGKAFQAENPNIAAMTRHALANLNIAGGKFSNRKFHSITKWLF